MAAVTVFALSQRSEARTQAREAKAHELEALSAAGLLFDPERSLLLAREAARMAPSETAEETLRTALLTSRVRTVVDVGEPLLGAMLRGGEVRGRDRDWFRRRGRWETGQVRRTFAGGKPAVHASFADDGSALFTGRDGRVRIVRPGGGVAEIPGLEDVKGAEISPDASLALAIEGDRVRVVEVKTGAVRQVFIHRGAMSAAISRGNGRIATGSSDETVRVWIADTGRLVRTLPDNKGNPTALAFSPNGAFVAAASTDGLARVWRFARGGVNVTVTGAAIALSDVAYSTDGVHITTSSRDGTVRISKSDTGGTLLELAGHGQAVTSAAFSGPAGSAVVTASLDGTARVWDALYQPELVELARLSAPVTVLEIDSDGQIHATAGGRSYVLDLTTGKELSVGPGEKRQRTIAGPNGMAATILGNTVVLRAGGREHVLEGHRAKVFGRCVLARRDAPRDRQPGSRRPYLGHDDRRDASLPPAQLRCPRRRVQPRRTLARHRGHPGRSLGPADRCPGRTSPGSRRPCHGCALRPFGAGRRQRWCRWNGSKARMRRLWRARRAPGARGRPAGRDRARAHGRGAREVPALTRRD